MKKPPLRSLSAFTLLEIMLVVIIIALLLSAAMFSFGGYLSNARKTRALGDIQSISNGMKMYQATAGFYPSTDQGVTALVKRPEGDPGPKQWNPLLERLPTDPWGREYIYVQPGLKNPDTFDVYTKGEDGKAGTADDMGNWE